MAIAQEPTKWTMPLGVNADANDIPDTAPEYTGNASMDSVFPPITQLPLEAGGIAPTRADFNGLFKLLGASIYYLQRGGIFSYADNVDYPAGAVVKFGNGIYIAIQANGPASTVAGPSNTNYWRHLATTVNNQYADANGNVNDILESGQGYIRFSNGIQICMGYNLAHEGTFIYAKPFVSPPILLPSVVTSGTDWLPFTVIFVNRSNTSVAVGIWSDNVGAWSPNGRCDVLAWGFWK